MKEYGYVSFKRVIADGDHGNVQMERSLPVTNDETVAYLVPADGVAPLVALQRAVSGFRQREGEMPTWAAAGAGVDLPEDALALLGLRRDAQRRDVRPGCILVGASAETVSAS